MHEHPSGGTSTRVMTSDTSFVVARLELASAVHPAEVSERSGIPAGPVLILAVTDFAGHTVDVVLPLSSPEHAETLAAAFAEALDALRASFTDPSIYGADVERSLELNRLAGAIPGGPAVRCPGCGSRLFGEVAVRGGCLACYPDLPPGEVVMPTLRWPEAGQ